MIDSISIRPATELDRHDLARFICGPGDEPFIDEVQSYIRHRALDDHLVPSDPNADVRLLVVRAEPGHRLVAVASHGANHRVADAEGRVAPGTELSLLAIALAVQGDLVQGRSLFRSVLQGVIEDIVERERGDLLCFVVHEANLKMQEIARSWTGFEEHIMSSGHVVFVGSL